VSRERVTPYHFIKAKREGRKLVMVTAYEYIQARLADEAGLFRSS
jgi:ketopantoate hydroxymethyltransferase